MSIKRTEFILFGPYYSSFSRELDIEELATRVYGKPFDSLRSAQAGDDNLRNYMYIPYFLEEEDDYLEELNMVDHKEVYLGWDTETGEGTYHKGHTYIEYWLSVKWERMNGDDSLVATVDHNNPEHMDKYGAIYPSTYSAAKNNDFAQRETSAPLSHILADLIRKGELPRANYLFDHSW